jgi:O-antigen ligase/polysaccharide polymerase Wzy-like membrane protein
MATLRDSPLRALRRAVFVSGALAFTIAVGVAVAVKGPAGGLPLPLAAVAVAVPAWCAITNRARLALAVVLLYLGLLDGVVRLGSGGQGATLVRDVFLYAVAIGVALRARGPLRLPALGGWVLAWILVVLVQLANPGNESTLHAVASLRQHLEFIPLFFLGWALIRSYTSLHAFFAVLLAVAAINGIVAAYQSTMSPDQLASWGPGYSDLVSGSAPTLYKGANGKPHVRPPGLGSDEGFSGILGACSLPGGIALLMAYKRRRWLSMVIVLGIICAAIGVLVSASRSSLITALVALLAMLGLMAVGGQAKRALLALCLVVALAGTAVLAIGDYNSGTFYRYTSIAPGQAASTIYTSRSATWSKAFQYMAQIPFGAGLGSVGPAATKAGGVATTYDAESQFTFLIVELGIPGLVLFLAFQGALCATVVRGLRREHERHTVVLMAGLAAPLFGFAVNWFVGVNTTSTPNAPYLWFAAGVLAWWLADRPVERLKTVRPATPPPRAAALVHA